MLTQEATDWFIDLIWLILKVNANFAVKALERLIFRYVTHVSLVFKKVTFCAGESLKHQVNNSKVAASAHHDICDELSFRFVCYCCFFKDALSLFLSVGAVLLVSADSDSISLLALFSVSDLSVMYSWNDFNNGQDDRGSLRSINLTLYLHHVHLWQHSHIVQRSACSEVTLLRKIVDGHEQPASLLNLRDNGT